MIKAEILCLFALLLLMSCQISNREDEMTGYNYGEEDSLTKATESLIKQPPHWPASFGWGRKATKADISALDIDISPSGEGLPKGKGDAQSGKVIYEVKCIACHGKDGNGGPGGRLYGVIGDTIKAKTIGNYWPYSSTLFDYIRRAMPLNAPGSLKDNEVYSLSAYLLAINKIIDPQMIMDRKTLPKVKMPAQPFFVPDDRHGGDEVR